jgi:hypothetical protein
MGIAALQLCTPPMLPNLQDENVSSVFIGVHGVFNTIFIFSARVILYLLQKRTKILAKRTE